MPRVSAIAFMGESFRANSAASGLTRFDKVTVSRGLYLALAEEMEGNARFAEAQLHPSYTCFGARVEVVSNWPDWHIFGWYLLNGRGEIVPTPQVAAIRRAAAAPPEPEVVDEEVWDVTFD